MRPTWWLTYSRLGVRRRRKTVGITKLQGLGFNLTTDSSCQQNPKMSRELISEGLHQLGEWHCQQESKWGDNKSLFSASADVKHQIKMKTCGTENRSTNPPRPAYFTSFHFESVVRSEPSHSFVIEQLTTLT